MKAKKPNEILVQSGEITQDKLQQIQFDIQAGDIEDVEVCAEDVQPMSIQTARYQKKCDEGFERMKDMPICEKFYTDMAKQGWGEQANTFKSIVLYTTILHPEWTDKEIFLEFANNMRK